MNAPSPQSISLFLTPASLLSPKPSWLTSPSFRVGGPAEWFADPQTIEQLQESYQWGIEAGYPITFLGAGSNLLISDQGLPGLIISTRHLKDHHINPDTGLMTADAGKPIPRLSTQAAKHGCTGFEWAVGIPGTIGGAIVMNAGAHGGCVADNLVEAHILQPNGSLKILTNEQLQYSYRSSILQGTPELVVRAIFQLTPGQDAQVILNQTHEHRDHRLSTQPYDWPSCGRRISESPTKNSRLAH